MKNLPVKGDSRRIHDIFQIAKFILENPGCSSKQVLELAEISATAKSTCINQINAALEFQWAERTGSARDIRYAPTLEFRHRMASLAVEQKTRKDLLGYNPEFLGDYKPNRHSLLTAKQLARMEQIGGSGLGVGCDLASPPLQAAMRRFITDFSFHSSKIEGIRAKYADTIAFLEEGIESADMTPKDATILRNHYNTLRWVVDGISHPAQESDVDVSEYYIRTIHSSISDGLLKSRNQQGRLRTEGINVQNTRYVPLTNPAAVSGHFHEMIAKAREIENPWEKSFFLAVHIPYLQPFIDCNKRTSRMCANLPLLKNSVLPISWADTDGERYNHEIITVYEHNEVYGLAEIFCEAYERSRERFDLSYRDREPDRLELIYAKEIATNIQMAIMDGVQDHIPDRVEPKFRAKFLTITSEILEAIKENEMVASPYRIPRAIVSEWRIKQESNDDSPKI